MHENKKIFVRYCESKIAIVFSYLKKHRKKIVLKIFPEKNITNCLFWLLALKKNINNRLFVIFTTIAHVYIIAPWQQSTMISEHHGIRRPWHHSTIENKAKWHQGNQPALKTYLRWQSGQVLLPSPSQKKQDILWHARYLQDNTRIFPNATTCNSKQSPAGPRPKDTSSPCPGDRKEADSAFLWCWGTAGRDTMLPSCCRGSA